MIGSQLYIYWVRHEKQTIFLLLDCLNKSQCPIKQMGLLVSSTKDSQTQVVGLQLCSERHFLRRIAIGHRLQD